MPQIRQLEYLVALAETCHFRRAAERVHTTQPTLSEQIKALEDRLGVQLVERSTARVIITPLGQQIVEIARRILRDAAEIRSLAASGGRDMTGLLRLGVPPTIGPYLLKHVVPKLHRTYPELRLYVREENPSRLPRALEDGALDVIVTPLPLKQTEIETVPLFREPLYLTVGSDHRLARQASVRLHDLAGEDVLALGPGHQLHEAVAGLCADAGARMRLEFEATSLDMLREMVITGLGITFMPGLYAATELVSDSDISLKRLADRSLYRSIGMAWRTTSARRNDYATLAKFFVDSAPASDVVSLDRATGAAAQ